RLREGRQADGHPREPWRGRPERGLEGARRAREARRDRCRDRDTPGGDVSNLSADLQETTDNVQDHVEIRTDARVTAAIGGVASIVAIAYLARAIAGGGLLDWALVIVTGAIAAAHLQSFVDARVPLLVVDR